MADKLSLKHFPYIGAGSTGDLPIYLRITYDRKKAEMHTDYTTKLKDWDEDSQNSKVSKAINYELAS